MPTPDATLTGRAEVIDAWRQALLALDPSPTARPAVLTLIDADFSDWPLNEPAVLDALARWLRPPGRQWRLMALDFAATERAHPRLARWRREVAHLLWCGSPVPPVSGRWPSWLLAPGVAVERLDGPLWRGRRLSQAADWVPMGREADALAQRCEAAWPPTILGL